MPARAGNRSGLQSALTQTIMTSTQIADKAIQDWFDGMLTPGALLGELAKALQAKERETGETAIPAYALPALDNAAKIIGQIIKG